MSTTTQPVAEFFAELDQYEERIPLERLTDLLRELAITRSDIERFAKFSARSYQRNLMREGPAYQALILCWRSGQRSPLHDHRGSSCGVRVLDGALTETVFERTHAGHVYATHTRHLPEGGVCGSQDADIHQVSNLQDEGQDLVTLHVYSPPLMCMGMYSLETTRIRDFVDPVVDFQDGGGI